MAKAWLCPFLWILYNQSAENYEQDSQALK